MTELLMYNRPIVKHFKICWRII